MKKSYVFYQGQILDESGVNISIRSKAFNYGLACFEGIRAYFNAEENQLYVFRLKDHYDRLLQSCKALYINIPYTSEELCSFTVELLKANNHNTTTYIRPIAFKGSESVQPTLFDDDNRVLIYTSEMGNYAGKSKLKATVTSWKRIEDNMLPPRTKASAAYLNSGLASLEAVRKGYDEAIFLTNSGHVCEGPGENIFIVRKGKLITPPPSDNILEGITRDTVMELAKNELGIEVIERSISRTELYAAEEVFFSGTAMEVTSVVEVDDRVVGDGEIGQVCSNLQKLFFEITSGKNPKYAHYCTPVY